MGYPTDIEWTDATLNPIGGCSIRSLGCQNCYSQRLIGTRLINHPMYAGTTTEVRGKHVFNGKLTIAADDRDVWQWPLRWRGAKNPRLGRGMPSLIFVGDMSDLFHENRPTRDMGRVVDLVEPSKHIAQFLTKRPDVMARFFEGRPVGRSWLGFSAERQQEFDERWPYMRKLANAGWTVFVSIEPMIGPVRLPDDFLDFGNRLQVIVGGESGPDRRETNPDWMRALRDSCGPANVAYFTKQMTGKRHIPPDLMVRQFPAVVAPEVLSAPAAAVTQMSLI